MKLDVNARRTLSKSLLEAVDDLDELKTAQEQKLNTAADTLLSDDESAYNKDINSRNNLVSYLRFYLGCYNEIKYLNRYAWKGVSKWFNTTKIDLGNYLQGWNELIGTDTISDGVTPTTFDDCKIAWDMFFNASDYKDLYLSELKDGSAYVDNDKNINNLKTSVYPSLELDNFKDMITFDRNIDQDWQYVNEILEDMNLFRTYLMDADNLNSYASLASKPIYRCGNFKQLTNPQKSNLLDALYNSLVATSIKSPRFSYANRKFTRKFQVDYTSRNGINHKYADALNYANTLVAEMNKHPIIYFDSLTDGSANCEHHCFGRISNVRAYVSDATIKYTIESYQEEIEKPGWKAVTILLGVLFSVIGLIISSYLPSREVVTKTRRVPNYYHEISISYDIEFFSIKDYKPNIFWFQAFSVFPYRIKSGDTISYNLNPGYKIKVMKYYLDSLITGLSNCKKAYDETVSFFKTSGSSDPGLKYQQFIDYLDYDTEDVLTNRVTGEIIAGKFNKTTNMVEMVSSESYTTIEEEFKTNIVFKSGDEGVTFRKLDGSILYPELNTFKHKIIYATSEIYKWCVKREKDIKESLDNETTAEAVYNIYRDRLEKREGSLLSWYIGQCVPAKSSWQSYKEKMNNKMYLFRDVLVAKDAGIDYTIPDNGGKSATPNFIDIEDSYYSYYKDAGNKMTFGIGDLVYVMDNSNTEKSGKIKNIKRWYATFVNDNGESYKKIVKRIYLDFSLLSCYDYDSLRIMKTG